MIDSSSAIPEISCPNDLANALKALGHPVRLKMLQQMRDIEKPCCGDICECFPHSQSTISQHLSVLMEAGLVTSNRDGNRSRFSINQDACRQLMDELGNIVSNGKKRTL